LVTFRVIIGLSEISSKEIEGKVPRQRLRDKYLPVDLIMGKARKRNYQGVRRAA
jgi:hypothetical protein